MFLLREGMGRMCWVFASDTRLCVLLSCVTFASLVNFLDYISNVWNKIS